MTEQIDKDRSILGLLSRLHTELGAKAFDVVDHWDSDLCAIGLAMPSDHATLIYVSSYGHPMENSITNWKALQRQQEIFTLSPVAAMQHTLSY